MIDREKEQEDGRQRWFRDLPLFDTEVRPVREFVAQEQRQEDDYQYITRMYSALAR